MDVFQAFVIGIFSSLHSNLNSEQHGETYTGTAGIEFPQGVVVSS